MREWVIEFDTIEIGWFEERYHAETIEDVKCWASGVLMGECGGHADIFDEEGDFVDDVEV